MRVSRVVLPATESTLTSNVQLSYRRKDVLNGRNTTAQLFSSGALISD